MITAIWIAVKAMAQTVFSGLAIHRIRHPHPWRPDGRHDNVGMTRGERRELRRIEQACTAEDGDRR
jgi:hypothetical protein